MHEVGCVLGDVAHGGVAYGEHWRNNAQWEMA